MRDFSQNNFIPTLEETINPRIGVITLSTDFTIEQDFRKICNGLPVDIFFNRIPFLNPLTHENYIKMADHLAETAHQILPHEIIQVMAYGCTSGTIEIGEKRIKDEIQKSKKDTQITTPITAAVKAFNLSKFKKIAVLTPYPKEVNRKVYNYLLNEGLDIMSFNSFNLNYDSEIAKVTKKSLIETISSINLKNVDCLFVSCTALKIVDLIDDLEKELNINLISSNQAIIWDSLRLSKINQKINGFGRLFKTI
ncbi:racemase [Pelagibacteraceae bacterium]|nr:racemase [Pelagibacteraceae bacterium]